MTYSNKKQNFLACLQAFKVIHPANTETPDDYTSLIKAIIDKEGYEEVEILVKMSSSGALEQDDSQKLDQLQTTFKDRCRHREKKNNATCLSFTALPMGAVNQMYWNLAIILFEPSNLNELLSILLPTITEIISIELPKNSEDRLQLATHAIKDEIIPLPFTSSLETFVIADNRLFDMNQLANLPLETQQHLYHLFKQVETTLAKKIYSHNDELQTLESNIMLLSNQAPTPKEAIERLIHELIQTNSVGMGMSQAGRRAQLAYDRFFTYWDKLPKDLHIKLKEIAFSPNDDCIHAIVKYIKKSIPVHHRLSMLQEIISLETNQAFLQIRPQVTSQEVYSIKQSYRALSIPIAGREVINGLSTQLFHESLSIVKPDTVGNWCTLLYHVPIHLYSEIIKKRMIGLWGNETANAIKYGFLSPKQKKALVNAMFNDMTCYSEVVNGMLFALDINEPTLFSQIFESIATLEEKLTVMKERIGGSLEATILRKAVKIPECFLSMWRLYPDDHSRFQAVNLTDRDKETVIYASVRFPDTLKIILNSFEDRTIATKMLIKKNLNGSTAIHFAAHFTDSLQVILDFFTSDKAKLKAVLIQDNEGDTVLHKVIETKNHAALKVILNALPASEDKLAVLKLKNKAGYTALYSAHLDTNKLNMYQTIQAYLPADNAKLAAMIAKYDGKNTVVRLQNDNDLMRPELEVTLEDQRLQKLLNSILALSNYTDRRAALMKQDNSGQTILHQATCNHNIIIALLNLLSAQDKLIALNTTDNNGRTVLHCVSYNRDSIQAILTCYPDNQAKLKAAMRPDHAGNIVFLDACKSWMEQETFKGVLDSFSDDKAKLDVVMAQDKNGTAILHLAGRTNLNIILNSFSDKKDIQKILNVRGRNGNTVLHVAANRDYCIRYLLVFFPNNKAKLDAVKETNDYGTTVLHLAASNTNNREHRAQRVLNQILALYPDRASQLEAISKKNTDGKTVLHYAIGNVAAMSILLALYQNDEDRLAALLTTTKAQETVLQGVNQDCMQSIFASFSSQNIWKKIYDAIMPIANGEESSSLCCFFNQSSKQKQQANLLLNLFKTCKTTDELKNEISTFLSLPDTCSVIEQSILALNVMEVFYQAKSPQSSVLSG